MSKFIELTYLDGSKCFVKGIVAIRERRGNRSVILEGGADIYVTETAEEIAKKAQEQEEALLRDEFAKEVMGSLLTRKDIKAWDHILRTNADVFAQKRIVEQSYKFADEMLKERSRDTSR